MFTVAPTAIPSWGRTQHGHADTCKTQPTGEDFRQSSRCDVCLTLTQNLFKKKKEEEEELSGETDINKEIQKQLGTVRRYLKTRGKV